MNYVIKNDNPDFAFSVSAGEVKDAEGEVIPDAELNFEIESSNPDVLGVTLNDDGRSGNVHVGRSGTAAFTVLAKAPNGDLLGSGGDNFTVTTGDPKSVAGINTSFEGLTPVEEPPPETVSE